MYKPSNINLITIAKWENNAPHLPFGFLDFEEGSDGAGDYYGLYWCFGKENDEPIVCWFKHEQSLLTIKNKNLNEFLYEINLLDSETELVDFSISFGRAKVKAKKGEFGEVIVQLKKYLDYVPEHSEAWALLAEMYLQLGQTDDFEKCALKSILSNWSFGIPTQKSIQLLKKINQNGILKNDPIIKRLDVLQLTFEYNKTEISYEILKDAYLEYFTVGDFITALILEHNYALMMYFETQSVQDLHNFNLKQWRIDYAFKCEKYLNRTFENF